VPGQAADAVLVQIAGDPVYLPAGLLNDRAKRTLRVSQPPRDLAIVGLMLLQGLRSCEVLALNRDDLILSEAQIRVLGKGNKPAACRKKPNQAANRMLL
jgi:site-specific recombinase XerC